jgi:hypothetical protein
MRNLPEGAGKFRGIFWDPGWTAVSATEDLRPGQQVALSAFREILRRPVAQRS